jgi:hypothetical protein
MCGGIVSSPADEASSASAVDVKLRALDLGAGVFDEDASQRALLRRELLWGRDGLEDVARDVLASDRSRDLPPWRPAQGSPNERDWLYVQSLRKRMRAGDAEAAVGWRLGWWRHHAGLAPIRTGWRTRPVNVSVRVRPRVRASRPAFRAAARRRASRRARSPGRLGDGDPEPPLARLFGRTRRRLAALVRAIRSAQRLAWRDR